MRSSISSSPSPTTWVRTPFASVGRLGPIAGGRLDRVDPGDQVARSAAESEAIGWLDRFRDRGALGQFDRRQIQPVGRLDRRHHAAEDHRSRSALDRPRGLIVIDQQRKAVEALTAAGLPGPARRGPWLPRLSLSSSDDWIPGRRATSRLTSICRLAGRRTPPPTRRYIQSGWPSR